MDDRTAPWWHGAVVYQIYPRSFCDSSGDGIGDLAGISSKLGYLADLGVDALWLSPIYPSPNRDFGYDVADYKNISSDYGTLAEFDQLLEAAHQFGLRVIMDQVLSHSSDLHPWFQDSVRRRSGKEDWYVWADPKPDGTPPNNWLSVFGGPAWSYHPARRQYYFHKFLKQQPKLNLTNPDVADAMLDVLRFWLDRGVDGFRLDVANTFLHDSALRDNPPVPAEQRREGHWAHADRLQKHVYDSNRPENMAFIRRIRELVDQYKDRFVFGEFAEMNELIGTYAGGEDGLHSGYTFSLLHRRKFDKQVLESEISGLKAFTHLWPCNTFSNHDVTRIATRWRSSADPDRVARLALLLLMTMQGTPLLYQGEELGLPEAEVPFDLIQDPIGRLYFPDFRGRDGCRTPMPWTQDGPHAGFSDGQPWLPLSHSHKHMSAAGQENDNSSLLVFSKALIALRKATPALALGDISLVDLGPKLIAYERLLGEARTLCVLNLEDVPQSATLPAAYESSTACLKVGGVMISASEIDLEGYSAVLLS